MHTPSRSLNFMVAALAAALHFACATSATGRKQLQLMSPDQAASMGAQAFQEVKQKQPIETDPEVNEYVRCVASQVLAAVDSEQGQWEVVTFRDPSSNAFALPGGKIGVHTGLLDVAKTQGQLAAVLGHEVAHVTQSHGNERVSQAFVAQGGIEVLLAALGTEGQAHDLAMSALGLGAQVGILMPYGRAQESEADVVGLRYMARAGFDPREAVELWKNMASENGGGPPEFLSTHPSHENRIDRLQSNMDQAMATYEAARQGGKSPHCTRQDAQIATRAKPETP